MNLQDVKESLSISMFNFNSVPTTDGTPPVWYRHWDNANRIAVSMSIELYSELKQPEGRLTISTLSIQTEQRVAKESGKPYTAHRIVKHKPAEATL